MQTIRVNGSDMAYLEVGEANPGPPLVCVHGTLGDFRTWYPVLGPLSKRHRVIAVSLRHFFPEHWDGSGDDYKTNQHIADTIGFIERLGAPVDLMGHSRGGRIAFGVGVARPELLRRLVLAEPGGDLDATLDPAVAATPASPALASRIAVSADKVRAGDIEGALQNFFEGIEGEGSWRRVPAAAKQQLRDNVSTFLGQVNENRKPYTLADAQAIRNETLLIGGGATKGSLSVIWRVLARHISGARTAEIPDTGHWMFEQAPQAYCDVVTAFLAG